MSKRNLLLLAFIVFVFLVVLAVGFKYRNNRPWRYHEHPEGVSVLVPHGLPTYPGAYEDDFNQKYTHVLLVEAQVADVYQYYLEKLPETGWTLKADSALTSDSKQQTIEVQQGKAAYRLVIHETGGKTMIIVQEIAAGS